MWGHGFAPEPKVGCAALQSPSAVPGFSSSYLLPPLPPCPGQFPPWLSAAGSSPLAKPSPPVGTRDGARELSSPAARTFSRRQTQRRSCHRIPEKSQRPSRWLLWGRARQESAQQTAPEQRKQSERRSKVAFRAPAPQREAQVQGERSTRGCGAQVPSHAPLCSARALAAIAFLRLYWKLEEVASANRGNWVTFQLALSSRGCSEVPVLTTACPAAPHLPAQHLCTRPAGFACGPPDWCPHDLKLAPARAPLRPLPQLLPLPHHLPLHLGWDNPKSGSQHLHLPWEVFGTPEGISRRPLTPAASWREGFAMLTGLGSGILPSPALLGEKHPDVRQILERSCPHATTAALFTAP